MIATPWGPSAVPTGGAGLALPAGIWILTIAATLFFAMTWVLSRGSELGDLAEVHLDERLAPEDVHQDLELHVIGVDLGDLAGEVGERAFLDPHALTHLVLEAGLGPSGLLGGVALGGEEGAHLAARQRRGLLALTALADEAGDARRVADAVPGLVVHLAADEEVAREDLA